MCTVKSAGDQNKMDLGQKLKQLSFSQSVKTPNICVCMVCSLTTTLFCVVYCY